MDLNIKLQNFQKIKLKKKQETILESKARQEVLRLATGSMTDRLDIIKTIFKNGSAKTLRSKYKLQNRRKH